MKESFNFERISHSINYPLDSIFSSSPRKILFAANLILVICSSCIAGFSVYLTYLLHDPNNTAGYKKATVFEIFCCVNLIILIMQVNIMCPFVYFLLLL
jgi:hypothetical protein